MCGRYAHSATQAQLVETFGVERVWDPLPGPDFNVAPTDQVPAVMVRNDAESGEPERRLAMLRWGLVPSWAKDVKIGARMINARAETVAEKPAFRKAYRGRRCLLPADGFYEWYAQEPSSAGAKPRKQPYFIHNADDSMMVMAGLYEIWRDPERPREDPQAWVRSCSVITTTASDAVGRLHDRMPLVVAPENWARWLDPAVQEPADIVALAGVSAQLTAYPVAPEVGNVASHGPHLIEPLVAADAPDRLC